MEKETVIDIFSKTEDLRNTINEIESVAQIAKLNSTVVQDNNDFVKMLALVSQLEAQAQNIRYTIKNNWAREIKQGE